MSKRGTNSVAHRWVPAPKLLEHKIPRFGIAALPQHERGGSRGRRSSARELLAREVHAVQLRQPETIEVRLGAILMEREMSKRPIGREDVRLAIVEIRPGEIRRVIVSA